MRAKNVALMAAALAGVLSLGRAEAATITQTVTTDFQIADLESAGLTYSLFDQRLGTLTGVSFAITGAQTASGSVTNTASQAQTFTVRQDVEFTFTDNGGPLDAYLSSLSVTPRVSQTYTNAAPGSPRSFGAQTRETSASYLLAPLSAFEAATGGFDTIYVSTLTATSVIGGGGNVQAVLATTARATFTVTYTYDEAPLPPNNPSSPVPLPALGGTIPGLLVGVGALASKARRRRKN